MLTMKRYFQLGLISIAAVVAGLSIGSLVSAADPFADCARPQLEAPTLGATYVKNLGETLQIKIKQGSCDYLLEEADLHSAGSNGGIDFIEDLTPQNGYYTFNLKLEDDGDFPNAEFEAEFKLRNPRGEEGVYDIDDIDFHLTVRSAPTPNLLICPSTKFNSPLDGATVSGTVSIILVANSAHVKRIFDITSTDSTPQHTESTSRTLSWNTTQVPNGDYVISSFAECASGYQPTSSPTTIKVKVANAVSPPASTEASSSTVTYTTPTGEKIEVKPELLAIPQYREVISAPKDTKLVITEAKPIVTEEGSDKVAFSGQAEPETKYTLVVFSEPKELDFTTGNDGNWQVELNESLEPGRHEAYIVLNDSSGKPQKRSDVISFIVPTAEAAAASFSSPRSTAASRARFYATYTGLTVLLAAVIFAVFEFTKNRIQRRKTPANTPQA